MIDNNEKVTANQVLVTGCEHSPVSQVGIWTSASVPESSTCICGEYKRASPPWLCCLSQIESPREILCCLKGTYENIQCNITYGSWDWWQPRYPLLEAMDK